MKGFSRKLAYLLVNAIFGIGVAYADNQTLTLSPVQTSANLPFEISIQAANFQLPAGVHSGAIAVFQGKWLIIAGRLNGMHGFGADPFPVRFQNTNVYVIDPATGTTYSRSMFDPTSGLTQAQIDTLSVTSPGYYQDGPTLYLAGGYGFDVATQTFGTKPVLTAIYLPGMIQWVMQGNTSAVKNIRQNFNQEFQITGGRLYKQGNVMSLVFGQTFTGPYTSSSNGIYSQQVRQFQILKTTGNLAVKILPSKPSSPDPSYRRRDLNVVSVMRLVNNILQPGLVVYGGVFTDTTGVWTVPVVIDSSGNPSMSDPNLPTTFKQAMNHYVCSTTGLYSQKNQSMYSLILGGLSFGYFVNGVFTTDSEVPFINQVTTIQMDKNGNFTQYLMNGQYPTIPSTTANPGNPLLFGTGGFFAPNTNLPRYENGVFNLDNIRKPTVIGYVVGGIASTVPNTNVDADSFASNYVFAVTLIPK